MRHRRRGGRRREDRRTNRRHQVRRRGIGDRHVSIGAAELADDDDVASWLARADEALYKAKRSGRNAVRAD
nr:diguanylate cyclase [Candidatus Mycolicibacterium alkanivorans]